MKKINTTEMEKQIAIEKKKKTEELELRIEEMKKKLLELKMSK